MSFIAWSGVDGNVDNELLALEIHERRGLERYRGIRGARCLGRCARERQSTEQHCEKGAGGPRRAEEGLDSVQARHGRNGVCAFDGTSTRSIHGVHQKCTLRLCDARTVNELLI